MDPQAAELDRLRELVNIGAGHAAGALADLLGKTFWMRVPRVVALEHDGAPRANGTPEDCAVLFEVEGVLAGVVAFLLPPATRRVLERRLLGAGGEAADPELLASVIREVGNIVVSQVCSAIADALGTRIVPSIPVLVLAHGEDALAERVRGRGASRLRIETEIRDEQDELRGRLAFVPDASRSRG